MVRVKICGITRPEDLKVAIEAGADAIGFVVGFEKSPRNLTIEHAAQLRRLVPVFIDSVIVTPYDNAFHERISRIKPDIVQLYGEYNPYEIKEKLDIRIIKPLDINMITKSKITEGVDAVLLDKWGKLTPGGTGQTIDWEAAARIKEELRGIPLILSGGLNPENVGEAIRKVNPYAVDVSSGVEKSPGIKDEKKIIDFIRRAKSID